jgi:hypothetical protein
MAIYDDDFESYALGAGIPFGSWTGSGFTNIIRAGGPQGTGQYFDFWGQALFTNGTYYSSFTIWLGFRFTESTLFHSVALIDCQNGLGGANFTPSLVTVVNEADSTISVYANNQLVGNSGNPIEFDAWHFLQLNVTLSGIVVLGVSNVDVAVKLAVDGHKIIDTHLTTSISVASLQNGIASCNRFFLLGPAAFDNFTLDVLAAMPSYPHPGTPLARVTQGALELGQLPDSAQVLVTQGTIELGQLPNSAQVLVTQGVIELILATKPRWYISES